MEAIASHEMQAGLCAGRGGLGGENTNFHEKVNIGGLRSISGRRDRLLTTRIKAAVLLLLAIMSSSGKSLAEIRWSREVLAGKLDSQSLRMNIGGRGSNPLYRPLYGAEMVGLGRLASSSLINQSLPYAVIGRAFRRFGMSRLGDPLSDLCYGVRLSAAGTSHRAVP